MGRLNVKGWLLALRVSVEMVWRIRWYFRRFPGFHGMQAGFVLAIAMANAIHGCWWKWAV